MNLYILRHGLAAEPGPEFSRDSERPLTAKGRQKVAKIAAALHEAEIRFDRILTSPYHRAFETAEIVAAAFKLQQKLEICEALIPGGSHRKVIETITHLHPAPEDLLLVGHEPSLSELISLLISGDTHCAITLKKAGFCKLTIPALRPGRCATLEYLLTPAQMVRGK